MESLVKEHELTGIEGAKREFMEAYKRQNADTIEKMTKSAFKKHEKVILTNWQQTNSVLGQSLSLDNAIMYMQNALSKIELKINSEVRYALHFKQVAAQ